VGGGLRCCWVAKRGLKEFLGATHTDFPALATQRPGEWARGQGRLETDMLSKRHRSTEN
jgi:hypothetical protein